LGDGELTFRLRSSMFKVNEQYVPIFINYTKFTINTVEVIEEDTAADHNHPIVYTKKVRCGEEVKVHIEWVPC
jgi:hypothetical protein